MSILKSPSLHKSYQKVLQQTTSTLCIWGRIETFSTTPKWLLVDFLYFNKIFWYLKLDYFLFETFFYIIHKITLVGIFFFSLKYWQVYYTSSLYIFTEKNHHSTILIHGKFKMFTGVYVCDIIGNPWRISVLFWTF